MTLIKDKIEKLRKKLDIWSKEYYENDDPSISDLEYDATYNKLLELEKKYPEYHNPNSITLRVGGKIDNRFKKNKHKFLMLSLGNAFNKEDLLKFDKQIKEALHIQDDISYIVEYKIDGLSISIQYKNGKFFKAITRGDGFEGEDVSHNVNTIKDIPKTIKYKNNLEVRGEIYMSNKVFEQLNKEGLNLANPRNAASGTIRQLDSNVAQKRNLSSFLYSVPNPLDHNLNSQNETLIFLKKNGIKINEKTVLLKNINAVIEKIEEMTENKDKLGYLVDGIVIKVNDIISWEDIGSTIKFPKYMIAYKFSEEVVETELLDIFPTVGRTGRITYNAKLSPIRLAGTTVRAATLHNAQYIEELGINVGDIVKVKKAGDIIPKVLGVKTKRNNEHWKRSINCPSCNSILVVELEFVDQYCENKNCIQKNIAALEHFASKQAVNIEGLSSETLKTFIKENLITDIQSIFKLKNNKKKILSLPGWKEKSLNNLLIAIENAKKLTLDKFIFSLGIRHIGNKNSKILAKRFGSLDNLIQSNANTLESIRDIGDKVANSLISFFKDEENRKIIKKLIKLGINIQETKIPKSNIFTNLTFVITGTLSKPRKHFVDIIESHNGNVSNSITSKTSYLFIGENVGSKLVKANELNIPILNEEQFNKKIKEKNE